MPQVIIRPLARIDIDGIWDYIADDSQAQADVFIDRMTVKFKLLARQPEIGRMRDDLGPKLRSFPFARHVIFYRAISGGIEIVRVLHSARDVDAQFRPGT